MSSPAERTGSADGRMRLTVLGGFLGSGKTTWLRHQLHAGRFADAAVVVNEAGETPVDNALLAQAARLSVLAGGCACCDALGDFVALLRKLCDERVRTGTGAAWIDRIVLETSGLANPGPIVKAIRADPMLVHHIVIHEIVVAIDAAHGLRQLREEPMVRRQTELADRLIITKTDEVECPVVATLLATLSAINPGATLSGAVKGAPAPLPDFAGVPAVALPETNGETDRPPILAARLAISDEIDWTAFSVWLSALIHARGDNIVRVKGVVRTPAGRLLLQSVRKIVQSPEILPETSSTGETPGEDNSLVFIGRGFRAEDLSRSLRYFAGRI